MRHFIYILALAALFSCTGEKTKSSGSRFLTPKVVDKLMAERYMFQSDTIYDLMEIATRDQQTKSKQLYMQGLDQYINQKNPAASVKLFRESILYCPDPKTYNYLANAYVDLGDTAKADSALNTVFEPDHEMFYTNARILALKKDTLGAIGSLAEAFSYGYSNKKRVENDKVFEYLRNHRSFQALVVTYLDNESKLREGLYKAFLASAPDLTLPFVMNRDSICYNGFEPSFINYDFAAFVSGMEDSRFSRDVSNEYYMVGKISFDKGMTAVLYKSVMIIADTLPPVEVKMAVFDSLGALLDERTFAQYELPSTLITGTIGADRSISIKEHKMKWLEDPLEFGYAGNEYQGEEFVSEEKLLLGPDGKIVTSSEEVAKK